MMLDRVQQLGHAGLSFFERLGGGHLFLVYVLAGMPSLIPRLGLVIKQV